MAMPSEATIAIADEERREFFVNSAGLFSSCVVVMRLAWVRTVNWTVVKYLADRDAARRQCLMRKEIAREPQLLAAGRSDVAARAGMTSARHGVISGSALPGRQ